MTESNAQNASMDEILSSIRDIVKEEAEKGTDSAAAAVAAPDGDKPAVQEPVAEDAVTEPEPASAPAAVAEEEEDEDILELTEVVEDNTTRASAEAPPEAAEPAAATEEAVAAAGEEQPDPEADVEAEAAEEHPAVAEPAATPDPAPAAAPAEAATATTAAPEKRVHLNALPSAQGLQLAFPVEVLAEALRPLVRDWVSDNLPDIVERLVREELSKLVEND